MDMPGFRLLRVYCCPFMMLDLGDLASRMMVLAALLTVSSCSALCVLASD